ncbi:restriction endonuclease subunit S [Campylobacter concisus]|uniref:restriction endonuclease subunit S n=1 Tax=Campylobacter concisus TaxID=199 RepID=UPI000A03D88E|nr:restriction endonuclease subunit S [Campylobacter concisus]ORI03946.1 restriction endonuclease subunit M [Campylobacter concisus]
MAIQSVEPNVAYMINSELKSYKLDIKMEQESLNSEIDNALQEYASKGGGKGGNKPDAKLLLQDKSLNFYPVLIEYKGYEDKLEKLDADGNVENRTAKNEPNFKNIKEYAVNGAIHYANALLHHTSYTDIIAIGVTGFKDNKGKLQIKIGVYYVSKSNLGIGQKVGDFSDLSFLKGSNFDEFAKSLKDINLSHDELEKIKQKREKEIDTSLVKLNNDIYNNEKGLGENDRVYLVAASIIATLGIPGRVAPLEKSQLKSSPEQGNTDGEILTRKIKAFLECKNIPTDKKELILRTLSNTILSENINKISDGQTQLKRVFCKIVDDLGIYYKIGLTTDFTGKLFNEMYSWLGFSQDKLNDVVLTPSYIATLLVRLARVNKDSYVWDFATGSAGLLVAAMNEMMKDAKATINSPQELKQKELKIKAEQLLGLEILPSIYMLAVLNMIMMGDGSSNILNKDSLSDFNGEYGFGDIKEKFPATAFVLNPPYSAPGNGMVFVETALNMMSKGYAAIIIQNSAGSGRAREFNKKILKHNTLVASIKMPTDLFVGKSSVQTNIYVFKVGEKHEKDEMVKFIDFSNDGYARSNRKKASNNLKIADRAHERYDELVNLVRFGASKLEIFTQNEYYEATIDPNNGADWNKSRPVDTMPTLADFKKSVSDYLSWEVSQILKKDSPKQRVISRNLENLEREFRSNGGEFREYKVTNLFNYSRGTRLIKSNRQDGKYPLVTAGEFNQGVKGFIEPNTQKIYNNAITIDMFCNAFVHLDDFCCDDNILVLQSKNPINHKALFYIATVMNMDKYKFGYGKQYRMNSLEAHKILLPTLGGEINFSFMEKFIEELERERVEELDAYLRATGLKNYELTQSEKTALAKFDEFSRRGMAKEFKIGDLFKVVSNPQLNKKSFHFSDNGEYPYFTRTVLNNGIAGYVDYLDEKHKINGNSLAVGMLGMQFFYMKKDFYAGQFTKTIYPKFDNFNKDIAQYFICWLNKKQNFYQSHLVRDFERLFNETKILLPISEDGEINYKFIKDFIKAIEKLVIKDIVLWADKKIEATKKVVNKA